MVILVTPSPSGCRLCSALPFPKAMVSIALSVSFVNGMMPLALIVVPIAFCSTKKQSQKATSTHHHRRKGEQDPGATRDKRRSKSPALPPKFDEVNMGSERGQNISVAVTHVHTNRKSRRQKKAPKSKSVEPQPTTSVGTSEDPYKRLASSSSGEDEEGEEDPNSAQPVPSSSRTGGQQQQTPPPPPPPQATPNPSFSRTSTKLKSVEMDRWMAEIKADREKEKKT